MTTQVRTMSAIAIAVAALTAGTAACAAPSNEIVLLKDARMKIELNATDNDAGIQVFIDAEPWKSMDIFDPAGRMIFHAETNGSLGKQGGTEFFMESAEPNFTELTFKKFLKRFPAGRYRMRGEGLAGERYAGYANFTHTVPAGPVLVSPAENAVVDPQNTVVQWQRVPAPPGSRIVGYQVLVVKGDSGIRAIPKIVLDVMMPASATSMNVPTGFLSPASTYEWEVLAIEKSGNQTLSSGAFTTP